jgi:hypothetical protein
MEAFTHIFAKTGKTASLILLVLALAPALRAAEITADQAADAVQAWIDEGSSMDRLAGAEVDSSATVATPSGSRIHVVKLAGGGFVITSADDRVDPVIAFSPSGTNLVQDASNPFWALISGDIAARERAAGVTASARLRTTKASITDNETPTSAQKRWASLLEKAAAQKAGTMLRGRKTTRLASSTVSDIRVDSFVQSAWNQDTHNGLQNGSPCYNYYTPNNYYCGCVATAGAQLMRYWQWPTNSVTPLTKTCKVNGSNVNKTMQGGIYNWASMPLVPADGVTEAQRQAIGKLTYDIGVAVQMNWGSGGSSANTFALVPRLRNTFGYANAAAAVYQSGVYPYSLAELKKVVIPNCDARSPMVMSISYVSGGFTYGHAAIVDGYGFSGNDFFIHVNLGWSGYNDAWYIPPDIDDYDTIDGLVFNVFPRSTGSIVSGRVLDAGGAPIANAAVHLQQGSATVASTTSDANGIYSFIASAGSYVVTADVLEGGVAVATASLGVQLASTTGTRLDDDGGYYYVAASIGNSYDNDIAITGVAAVPPPVFAPDSCLFYPSTNVSITCAEAGAVIRYTLDGSAPDSGSPVYRGPIFVDDTVTIRARAFATGKNPSAIVGATYTYDDSAGPPKGDYFDNPIRMSGTSGSRYIEDNSRYTTESGERNHAGYGQYRTIWYLWTAPGSGTMTFQSSSRGGGYLIPTCIAVYTGDTLASISRLAYANVWDDNYVTTLSMTVEQGVTYRIVAMQAYNQAGYFNFTWSGDLAAKPLTGFRIIVR